MKFAGAHGITRSRVPLIAMLALAGAIGLAGCEGDDGKDGAIGPTGPASTVPGPTGPTGPTGPAGQPVVQKPLESCAVCHDAGSVYAVDDAHQVADQGAFADFAVAPDGADLVVSFSATVDGAPVTTATFYRAYTWDGTARTTLNDEISADLPNLFANNGDGTYSIRIVNGVARFVNGPRANTVTWSSSAPVATSWRSLRWAIIRQQSRLRGWPATRRVWTATAPAARLVALLPRVRAVTTPRR
jgi:hypothetical protein